MIAVLDTTGELIGGLSLPLCCFCHVAVAYRSLGDGLCVICYEQVASIWKQRRGQCRRVFWPVFGGITGMMPLK